MGFTLEEIFWNGKRDSNSRPPRWQRDTGLEFVLFIYQAIFFSGTSMFFIITFWISLGHFNNVFNLDVPKR